MSEHFHESTGTMLLCKKCYEIGYSDGESSGANTIKTKLSDILEDVWPETSCDELYSNLKDLLKELSE